MARGAGNARRRYGARMSPLRRRLLGCFAFVVVGLLVAATVGAWITAETFVMARNGEPDASIPDRIDSQRRVVCGDVEIDVWIVEPEREKTIGAVDTALILHGKGDGKRAMAALGTRFARAGVRGVLVDLRGHGESTPTELSYGVHERADLSCVLDALDAETPVGEVGVYGPSYGGAVALQFAGSDPRVTKVVAVAAFRSFDAIARTMIELPSPGPWAVVTAAGWRGGFDADDASPERAVGQTEAEIVLVYSTDDEIVPFSHGQAVAEACGDHCRLERLEGYSHLGVLSNPELRQILHRHLAGEDYPPPPRPAPVEPDARGSE